MSPTKNDDISFLVATIEEFWDEISPDMLPGDRAYFGDVKARMAKRAAAIKEQP